jgi:peptide/nickel transport system substrate-binding protein
MLTRAAPLLLAVLLAGCSGQVPRLPISAGPVTGGQVVEAIAGTAGPLNPLFEQEANEKDIDSLIYQGLTTVDARQQVVGLLAKGWKVSDNGLTYTFDLRPDVRWADGKPFTADDVIFTFNVLQSPSYVQATAQYWKQVAIERAGTMQVKFTIKAPTASFPLALRQGIIPRHVFEHVGIADMAADPHSSSQAIGTGPFRVGSISRDRHVVTLDRNPYARPKPNLDHVVFRTYPSLADSVDAVSRGEADSAADLEGMGVGTLAKRQDLAVMQLRTFSIAAIFFNLAGDSSVYFGAPEVRQALAQAVDRQRIVHGVLEDRAEAAPGPLPPSDWAYSKAAAEKLSYNPQQALKTLQDQGWQLNMQTGILNKGGKDFSVSLVTTDAYPYKQVADAVSEQLRAIGVQVRVEPVPASVLVSKYLIGKQYQMALAAVDNGPDPDQYALWHSGAAADSLSFANADHPFKRQALIDKDLEDGRATSDLAKRREVYADFQGLMADAAPAIFIFEPRYTYLVSRRVRGLHTNPVIEPVDRFQYVTDWYVTTRG